MNHHGTLQVRVYYEDTDFSGVVYHASYLRFMERGRTELLRAEGVDQAALMANGGFGFAVRAMQIEFRSAAAMDDVLTIATRVVEVGGASLQMEQHVLRKDQLLVHARVKIAGVTSGRAARLPVALRNTLLVLCGNVPQL